MKRILKGCGRVRGCCVSAFGIGVLWVSMAVNAQEQPGISTSPGQPALEEIVVTGSRIARGSSFDANTPVTTFSAQDLKSSGTVNVESALSEMPQFVAATNGGSQSNVVPGGQAYINLRGLGQVRNLVLVNGRRFTVQGTDLTTDINTIPQALIERVEIVTGGSSAVYGSDAIAGVTNFVMRKNFEGVQLDGHVDFDRLTTTPTYSTDITAGSNFDDDRGNIAISMDYLNRGAIARDQVPYARPALGDGCVTPSSYNRNGPGTPVPGNPTGAGDAFSVAYLSARAGGHRPISAARRASALVSALLSAAAR